MEALYGIGVANRYAIFLNEDEDILEVLKVQEQEKEVKKRNKLLDKECSKGKVETQGKSTHIAKKGPKENVKAFDAAKSKENNKVKPTPRPAPERIERNVKFAGELREERNNKVKPTPRPAPERIERNVKFAGELREERNNKVKPTPRPAPERIERNVKFAGELREERNNKVKPTPQPAPERIERNVKFAGELREERRPLLCSGEFTRSGRDSTAIAGNEMSGRNRVSGRWMGRTRATRGPVNSGGGSYGTREYYANRPKREYDRQSGSDKTGVKPVDKRDGRGAHNWGNPRDDIAEQLFTSYLTENKAQWAIDKPDGDAPPVSECVEEKVADKPNEEEAEIAQPVEEEPRELTLDEYYAMRGSREKPSYNIRKAGEGEDLTQWKKMYVLKKKKEDHEEGEDEEYDMLEYPQRVGRQKYVLDIDINFGDSRSGIRGRGRGGLRRPGRGGPRGGWDSDVRKSATSPRGYGDQNESFDRGDREIYSSQLQQQQQQQQQSMPKVDDEHDFPSLG